MQQKPMISKIYIKPIVLGLLSDVAVTFALGAVFEIILGILVGIKIPGLTTNLFIEIPQNIVFGLVIGSLGTIVGAYIVARSAKEHKIFNALIMACIEIIIGTAISLFKHDIRITEDIITGIATLAASYAGASIYIYLNDGGKEKSLLNNEIDKDNVKGNHDNYTDNQKIGGWLIVVGIGLFLSVISYTSYIYNAIKLFRNGVVTRLSDSTSEMFVPHYKMFLTFELVCQILLFLLILWVLNLFFAKDRRFPKFYILMLIFALLFKISDVLVMKHLLLIIQNKILIESFKNVLHSQVLYLIGMFIGSILWIWYMKVSKRVQCTFVNISASE